MRHTPTVVVTDKRSVVWMERFLHAWKYERARSPKTLRAYSSDLRDFLGWLDPTPATKASKGQVREYLANLWDWIDSRRL